MATKLPNSTPTAADAIPFLVGIAGASSSGKTILSLILWDIFQAAMSQGQPNDTPPTTSSTAAFSTITMISQDDYSIPKNECPRTAFRPRSGDEAVVAGHVGADGKVETADSDCLVAINWTRLLGDIDAFLTGQKQQDDGISGVIPFVASAHQTELARYRTMIDSFAEPKLRERMIAEVRACIAAQVMFNTFDKFEGRLFKKGPRGTNLLNVRLGFVEGLLLYAREPPLPQLYWPPNVRWINDYDNASSSNQQQHQQRPEPRMQRAVKASQEAIRDRFHSRLYLHVTTETACQRRFSRDRYIDQPQGQRIPGQMCKTKGYFFDVAKANFYKYDSIDSTLVKQLWQGQNILALAIQSILQKMKEFEEEAREAARERVQEEAAMARVKGETETFW